MKRLENYRSTWNRVGSKTPCGTIKEAYNLTKFVPPFLYSSMGWVGGSTELSLTRKKNSWPDCRTIMLLIWWRQDNSSKRCQVDKSWRNLVYKHQSFTLKVYKKKKKIHVYILNTHFLYYFCLIELSSSNWAIFLIFYSYKYANLKVNLNSCEPAGFILEIFRLKAECLTNWAIFSSYFDTNNMDKCWYTFHFSRRCSGYDSHIGGCCQPEDSGV